MKTSKLYLMSVLFGVLTAFGLAQSETVIQSKVPFSFQVEKENLPPGEYTIKPVTSVDDKEWLIQSSDRKHSAAFLVEETRSEKLSASTKLVFSDVGNRHYLSQFWVEGEQTGWNVMSKVVDKANLQSNKKTEVKGACPTKGAKMHRKTSHQG